MTASNPLNWSEGGRPTVLGEEAEELQIQQNSLFLDLPPEMRGMILGMLSGADQNNCRLVCRLIKYDIEQDIGIHAQISGSESEKITWCESTLSEYLDIIAAQEEEIREAKMNLEWLKSVRVTSLDVQGLSHLPIVIGEPLLRSQSSLRTLILRLDEYIESGLKAIDIVNTCNCLDSFQMIYEAPKQFLKSHPVQNSSMFGKIKTFNSNLLRVLQEMLQGLSRTRLRHFKIFVDPIPKEGSSEFDPLPLADYYIGMPPLTQSLQIDAPPQLKVLEINMMQFRDVLMPYRLETLVHLWKAVLDAQTQLTHLCFRIGSIYWRYFEIVLKNCQRSLKSVEIDVGNWHDPELTPNVDEDSDDDLYSISVEKLEIPEEDWLDWSVLFTQNCELESLIIRMPFRAHATANKTKNFCLNFGKLKKLELHFVKLAQLNFQKVLLELPELKELTLKEWYIAGDEFENFGEYKEQSTQTLRLIRNALQLQRLESVEFYGQIVSGNIYSARNRPAFRQSVINVPNYSVNWSKYYAKDEHRFRKMMNKPTIHIKKNP